MKRKCSHCGFEPEFDNGYERCPNCFQLYEVANSCALCKVCLGCMLNTMKTNENKIKGDAV